MMTETVADIVSTIWSAVLGMEVSPAEPGDAESDARGPDSLTAFVQISGAWSGVIQVSFSAALSVTVAAAMLSVSEAETTSDDARDCMSELVNMIGGNLKATLPAPSSLSLPWVTAGRDYSVTFPHCTVATRLDLESAGQRMVVTVIAADAGSGESSSGDVAS